MFDNLRKILDFDDLLFKSRNREYGAYQLRKRYNSVLVFSIIFSSVLVSVAVIIPFVRTQDNDRVVRAGGRSVRLEMENLEQPPEEYFIPAAPPPPQAKELQEIVKYVPPVIVDSIISVEPPQLSNDEMLAQLPGNELEIAGDGSSGDLYSGSEGSESGEPFFLVEVMPAFKGGDINTFRSWVQKRTNYPQIAIDRRIQGKVFLTFIVEPNGMVSNVTVVQGVDPIIDDEAVKAIQSSPKWSPGLQRGRPVRVRFSMWLNFVF